ncbi:MAG: hypothetical protein ACKVUS_01540 [Saprospiraceae bacterium]
MKHLLFLALLLLSFNLFSQGKKAYYYDQNFTPLSEKDFWKDKDISKRLHLSYDVDTAKIFVKVTREQRGRIHVDSLKLLKRDLEISTNYPIDSTHLIVIDYYPGKDPCNSGGTQDRTAIKNDHKSYLSKLHSLAPISQFYIYCLKEGLERYKGIYNWKPDLNNRIENTFFQLHYPCGSLVVIRPDGLFVTWYGEYSNQQVWDYVKELRKK